jgi:hypothetical protein
MALWAGPLIHQVSSSCGYVFLKNGLLFSGLASAYVDKYR